MRPNTCRATKTLAQQNLRKSVLVEDEKTSQIPARKTGYKGKHKCQKKFGVTFQG